MQLHIFPRNPSKFSKVIFYMTEASFYSISMSARHRTLETARVVHRLVGGVSVQGPIWPKFVSVNMSSLHYILANYGHEGFSPSIRDNLIHAFPRILMVFSFRCMEREIAINKKGFLRRETKKKHHFFQNIFCLCALESEKIACFELVLNYLNLVFFYNGNIT